MLKHTAIPLDNERQSSMDSHRIEMASKKQPLALGRDLAINEQIEGRVIGDHLREQLLAGTEV